MKLLYCKKCGSLFNLSSENKSCECGAVSGRYIDNRNAIYTGNAVRLGIDNKGLARIIVEKKKDTDLFALLESAVFKITDNTYFKKINKKDYV